jgi:hypothetical protein
MLMRRTSSCHKKLKKRVEFSRKPQRVASENLLHFGAGFVRALKYSRLSASAMPFAT